MRLKLLTIVGLVATLGPPAMAQVQDLTPEGALPTQPTGERVVNTDQPNVAPEILRRLEAPFLTPEEGAALRLFHGVWRESDLEDPTAQAHAALIAGDYRNATLLDAATDPLLRAEALLHAGELERTLAVLDGVQDDAQQVRAARLRAEALHLLGRFDEADAALAPIEARLIADDATAEEIAEGVRALLRQTHRQGPSDAAGDFKAMVRMLAHARRLDRLDWRVRLAEAELLYAKDNRKEAHDAAREALSMNPSAARAWRLLGRLAVDSFSFDAALETADRLDAVVASVADGDAVSIEAARIRAGARIRQRDAKGALEILAPAMSLYPESRSLRALHAAATACTFDRDAANDLLTELDERSPGVALGHYEVGRALSEARQYDWSRDYLEEATRREPNWPDPWIQLGLMELQAGRDLPAKRALTRARELDPFHLRADNSLRLVNELLSWPTIETDHFVIRYRDGIDEVLAREMAGTVERVHDRVTGDAPGGLDHTPTQKTLVELMPDHAWFSVRITGVTDIWTMAAATGPVIAMEAPRAGRGKQIGPYDWARVFQHEYTHTVNLDRTRNRIPHWFTEANAVYNEDGPWDERRARLLARVIDTDGLFDFERANLMFVRPEGPTDRAQAYAQSAWMYEYMLERWGNEAPLAIMDAHRDGRTQDEAIRAGLGIETDEFFSDFTAWAEDRVAEWGLSMPEGVPPVEQLVERERVRRAAEKNAKPKAPGVFDPKIFELEDAFAPPETEDIKVTPELLETWLARYPDHPDLLQLEIERILDRTGGLPRAEHMALIERYAGRRPIDPLAHRVLAQMYLDGVGERLDPPVGPEGAIPHLEWLDAREIHSPSYASELARRYAAQRDWGRATDKIERALSIDPFNAPLRELAATIAIQAGSLDQAAHQIEALAMLEPDRSIHQRRLDAINARRAP
ncbi:MAG: hypothetical protein AAGK04_10130 [Planctomycetota bacterium]